MESLENLTQVFHPSHRPWTSLRDFHIPTASTMRLMYMLNANRTHRTAERSPYLVQFNSASFRLILRLEYAQYVQRPLAEDTQETDSRI